MIVRCPICHQDAEYEGGLAEGQHAKCPFCNSKFTYHDPQSTAADTRRERRVNATKRLRSTRSPNSVIHKPSYAKCHINLWNIFAGMLLFCGLMLVVKDALGAFVVLVVAVLFAVFGHISARSKFSNMMGSYNFERLSAANRSAYKRWLDEVQIGEGFALVNPPLRLGAGEEAYFFARDVRLFEHRVVGVETGYSGGAVSVGDVTIGSLGSRSSYVRGLDHVDTGLFCVTNKRILFVGTNEQRTVEYADFLNGEYDAISVVIATSSQKSRLAFDAVNGLIVRDIVRVTSRL